MRVDSSDAMGFPLTCPAPLARQDRPPGVRVAARLVFALAILLVAVTPVYAASLSPASAGLATKGPADCLSPGAARRVGIWERLGDAAGAIHAADALVARCPLSARAWFIAAEMQTRFSRGIFPPGSMARAERDYRHALRLDPAETFGSRAALSRYFARERITRRNDDIEFGGLALAIGLVVVAGVISLIAGVLHMWRDVRSKPSWRAWRSRW